MTPLKIAHVASYYAPALGGVAQVVRYLCAGLAARGHEVHAFVSDRLPPGQDRAALPAECIAGGVHVHRLPTPAALGHMVLCPGVYAAVRHGGFDIVHAHAYRRPHGDLAALAARRAGVPAVLHLHGGFDPGSRLKAMAYGAYDAAARLGLLNRFDHYIALTSRHEERLRALGIAPAQIAHIPNAAAEACFAPADAAAFRRAHAIPDSAAIVLYLGMLHAAKRPGLLLHAMRRVVREAPHAVLVIAGPDAGQRAALERLAVLHGLGAHARFTGPLFGCDAQAALEAACMVCLPSDEDAAPLVALEAAARGRPLVLSDAVGTAAMLHAHGAAAVFPRGDAAQLAQRIAWLLRDPPAADAMGRRGRKLAEAEFCEDAAVDRVEALYRALLRRLPRRAHAIAAGAHRGGFVP